MPYYKIIFNFIILTFLFIFQSCDDYGSHGPDLSGTVTFTGTSELNPSSGGYFAVLLFENNSEAFHNGVPVFTLSLSPEKKNGIYTADFGMSSAPARTFLAAVTWVYTPYQASQRKSILGIYGCNTDPNCTTYASVDGSKSINITANGDTAMKLFYNN
ncbi:MAG: hypothetical protein EHM58_03025 [Ignavibacteriae bacterium]|nr:MAG: hypothetical protein EHM58_03025 [Ignavibacteriota bacterium]